MAGITILIEYPWTSSYSPWLSSSYPWATIGGNEILGFNVLSWNNAINDWDHTYSTWSDSLEPCPSIIAGTGVSFSATEEILTISVQDPSIVEGIGTSFSATEESLVISVQNPTIVEGEGISFLVSVNDLNITSLDPEILLDFTVFPDAENLLISIVEPRRTGALWEIRIEPTTNWTNRTKPTEKWETRNQVLWSYRVLPWTSTYYPWLVTDRIKISTWNPRSEVGLTWNGATMTWDEFTNNWDGYKLRTKPTTTWQQ